MMTQQNNTIQIKNAFFFSHDSNARNDEKIINLRMKYGAEGYGLYFMLIEMLMEASDYMLTTNYLALAFNLHTTKDVLQSVIEDFDLFQFSDDIEYFYSESLNKRIAPLEHLREQRRKAGLRSAEVRREKLKQKENIQEIPPSQVSSERVFNECSTSVDQKLNRVEKSRVDKRIVDETKAEQKREDRLEAAHASSEVKATRFVPPTLELLKNYCIENKYNIDIQSFLDFYESKGWMVGRNKMKDWRAALRGWVRRSKEELQKSQKRHQEWNRSNRLNIANFDNTKKYEKF